MYDDKRDFISGMMGIISSQIFNTLCIKLVFASLEFEIPAFHHSPFRSGEERYAAEIWPVHYEQSFVFRSSNLSCWLGQSKLWPGDEFQMARS